MEVKLNKPFAANSAVDEFDVRQMKKALNCLGYYQPYEKIGITGIPDAGVFKALKEFQKDQGLIPTGTAKPGDETVVALNKEASKTPEGQYIWRTVEDSKVRSSHAELNRTVRDWSNSPDPGEEFNCRCWAEPVSGEKYGPPDCRAEQESYDEEKKKFIEIDQKLEKVTKEIEDLEKEKQDLLEKIRLQLIKTPLITLISGTPLAYIESHIFELAQRILGNTVQNSLMNELKKLMDKFTNIRRQIEQKMKEKEKIKESLEKAERDVLKALEKLNSCKNRHV